MDALLALISEKGFRGAITTEGKTTSCLLKVMYGITNGHGFHTFTQCRCSDPWGIAPTSYGAKSFVSRLIMQIIIDVLEQQGRSAGLSDDLILGILNQLMVHTNCDLSECKTLAVNQAVNKTCKHEHAEESHQYLIQTLFDRKGYRCAAVHASDMPLPHCIVVGNTVTALCTDEKANMCRIDINTKIGAIDAKHLSILESLTSLRCHYMDFNSFETFNYSLKCLTKPSNQNGENKQPREYPNMEEI
ncbi:hypothetical protein KIN20_007440 [Parelaphostrongylus tenuis]|uniref:Uncharacterized protein n=1 Tax=Parelaphostrongylus tenuis TaxID=148309 RepID=A0AAD5M5I9_PARTN|nr:hypothetical protein KIN20_007440 [Parelaphostrongylus tenuis]